MRGKHRTANSNMSVSTTVFLQEARDTSTSCSLCSYCELELVTNNVTVDFLHVFDDVVGTAVLDLAPLVRCADSNDGSTGSNTGADTAGRVFEDDTFLGVVAEALGSEEEGIGERLAILKTLVVGGDGDFGRGDTNTSHATVSYQKI